MTHPGGSFRSLLAAALLVGSCVACADEAAGGAAPPTASATTSIAPVTTTSAGAAPTTSIGPALTTAVGPASTATAIPPVTTPTQIPTPSVTPTPAIRGEAIASTSALARSQLPLVEFSRAGAPVAALPIEVLPPAEFPVGFSGRPSLSDERGMLFWYKTAGRGSFWMKNTHFDLAIAFVAADERIVDIIEMHRESTSLVTPQADYQYAIEAPAGWYLAHGVRLGDRAHLAFPLPAYLTDQGAAR